MLKKGLSLALITAFISGISNFVGKVAVTSIDPLLFTTLKNIGAFVFLSIFFMSFKTTRAQLTHKPNKKEVRNLILVAIIGGSLPFYLFFEGLRQIPAINGAMIHKSLIVWVAVLALPFLGEKLSRWQLAGVALLFSSNIFIGGFNRFLFNQGELMVFAATLLWSVENIIAKKTLTTVSAANLSLWRMGGGGVILFAMLLIRGIPSLFLTWQQLAIIGLTSALLFGYVATWYSALAVSKITTVASALVGATLITNALSAILITHSMSTEMLFQTIAICAGLALVILTGKKELEASQSKLSLS